jgi:MYXO-CTERM domain-containing protein
MSGTISATSMKLHTLFATTTALILACGTAKAATYTVGPGKTYANLGAVAGILAPGDIVLVDGNNTYPSVWFTKNGTASAPITIRGVPISGKRPVVSGGANAIEAQGNNYVFEGLEITGGTSRCFYHHADGITLRDSVVHDCPKQGILGADNDSGSMLMEFVEVYKCGGGTFDHQIYMATDEVAHPGSVFRMQHCYVHDGNGGNNVKSRAERNEIYYNWIEGALYHELELIGPDPAGGVAEALKREDSDVVGNVLFKRGTFWVVRFGGDGTGQSNGRYRFVNNTVVLQPGGSGVFRLFDGIDSLEAHNNVLYAIGGGGVNVTRTVEAVWVTGSAVISGTNNWIMTGSTNVPTTWTGTITGTDPSFVALTTNDLRPTATSPLIDKGGPATLSPTGHPFPSPLVLPTFVPPAKTVGTSAIARPVVSTIDIGAYEYGTVTTTDAGPDASVTDTGTPTDSGTPTDGGSDSGMPTDGGVGDTPGDDTGASPGDAAAGDSGSCGCRTPRGTPAGGSAIGFVVALAAILRRRRR